MIDNNCIFVLLRSLNDTYIYDANVNKIVSISEELYCYLADLDSICDKEISKEIAKEIEGLNNKQILKKTNLKKVEAAMDDDILKYYLSNKLGMLSLQLTQQCNFRCSYCKYTKAIDNRPHTNMRMSPNMAIKAIDFFAERSIDSKNVNVGFYGGEPLLEFELIRTCVEYSKKKFYGKPLSFSITTNGSLLTEKIMDYLCSNNTHILISLDGPKKINDYNRKYYSNGRGTFDDVMKNLEQILSNDRYRAHVRINSVINPVFDATQYEKFFNKKLFKNVRIYSPIVERPDGTLPAFSKEFANKYEYEKFLILKHLAYNQKMDNSFRLANSYAEFIENIERVLREQTLLPSTRNHSGPCIPGKKRLFVSTEGLFFPCEKVSESNPNNIIGSLDEGFNYSAVRGVLDSTKCISDECSRCWAIRFCDTCAKVANGCDEKSKALLRHHCASLKQSIKNGLLDYIALNEVKKYD